MQRNKKVCCKKDISHEDYKECLFSKKPQMKKMNVIRSHKHEIFSETVNKIALSADDDKRIIMKDKISTLAYGHKTILSFKMSKIITKAIEILKIILELLKTLKEKIGKTNLKS